MKKKISSNTVFQIFLAGFFLFGGIFGWLNAINASLDTLKINVTGYISGLSGGYSNTYLFFTHLLNTIKYPLTIFIFGFTVFGVLVIPAIVAIRGYSLAFAFASFVRVFGANGYKAILCTLGIQSLLTLSCLFILAFGGFYFSYRLLCTNFFKPSKRLQPSPPLPAISVYMTNFIICLFVLCVCALFDTFITPTLIALIKI